MEMGEMDNERIKAIELGFFRGETEQATKDALEIISGLDLDDDDECAVAQNLLEKGLTSPEPMHFAETLKESGFDGSIRFPDGNTLLTMYASRGRSEPDVVRTMIDMGADPSVCNRSGDNMLHLLAHLEKSPWAKEREAQMAEIAKMADPSVWMTTNAYGATPLHFAVMYKHTELAKALIDAGADPDAQGTPVRQGYGHVIDFDGVTPLDVACLLGDDQDAFMLLDAGANPSSTDSKGRMAIHYLVMVPPQALCREYESVMGKDAVNNRKKSIIPRLADIDAVDDAGSTPLITTLTKYRYDNGGLSEALIEAGADPNKATNNGTTPLMAAASNGFSGSVKALIAAGADLDARDRDGKTALHHAIAWRDEKSARLLIKKGAKYDIPDNSGVTAGEMAASAGMEPVLELML